MSFVFAKQGEVSDWLFEQVTKSHSGVEAVWQLRGAAGAGKTTTLLGLKARLRREGLYPILVSAPADELDAGAIALVELAGGLKREGLVNGETEQLRDLNVPSHRKLETAKSWVERHSDQVVLLCDEPGAWEIPGPEACDPSNRLAPRAHRLGCWRGALPPGHSGVVPVPGVSRDIPDTSSDRPGGRVPPRCDPMGRTGVTRRAAGKALRG